MRTSVPTPYGTLPISIRIHPVADAVIVTVAGPIHTPNRAQGVLGESVSLDYRYDALRGWYEVDWTGKPWIELPSMTVTSTTREIQAAVALWLSNHHEVVKALAIRRFEIAAARAHAASAQAIKSAAEKAGAADGLVDEVRAAL